jgi:anti-sigma B factor antagonist
VRRMVGAAQELVLAGARLRVRGGDSTPDEPCLLELKGEFDLDTVPEIDRFLRRSCGPLYERHHLVIDLGGTEFVDSSFISLLVRLLRDLRASRRELILARPTGQVRRTLATVGLPSIVPVFESVDAALAALGAGHVIPPAFAVT